MTKYLKKQKQIEKAETTEKKQKNLQKAEEVAALDMCIPSSATIFKLKIILLNFAKINTVFLLKNSSEN